LIVPKPEGFVLCRHEPLRFELQMRITGTSSIVVRRWEEVKLTFTYIFHLDKPKPRKGIGARYEFTYI
jgi:hypothetical protein